MLILPPGIGEQLNLGGSFQAVPFTATWNRIDLTTTDGGLRLDVLVFETATGRSGFVFGPDLMDTFKKATVQHASGLLLATDRGAMHRGN